MEQNYNKKMDELGYTQLVCDIFSDWEDVKDEILLSERKSGTGNGTVHVFLGAADDKLRQEFPTVYNNVTNGQNPADNAVEINHYFLVSNVLSAIGYVCQYYVSTNNDFNEIVKDLLKQLVSYPQINGMLSTKSYFKLSEGSSRLRPYFKQFESNGVFHNIIRKLLLPNSSYKISLYKNSNSEYAAFWLIGFNGLSNFEVDSSDYYTKDNNSSETNLNFQQIYYGAPGTGKSHNVKVETEKWEKQGRVVRTTFHPDSDYSTFVGCYKPTMRKTGVKNAVGKDEETIVYEFVPQAFLQAYVDAWKNMEEPEFLVIEEINRGNCAQIFGDLFQLLDRDGNGFSEYAIRADKDLQKYLADAFEDVEIDGYPKVKSGEELLLPNNFYIRATMNTSDQSLFPIDSAFKRRWDWKYIPIAKGVDKNTGKELDWKIEADGEKYDWWEFLTEINKIVFDTTNSEDKQLGFFFCKADQEGLISADTFVSKVIFYLWNDVFKDYGFDNEIFNDSADNGKLSFDKFYDGKGEVVAGKVRMFLKNLKLELVKADENTGTDGNAGTEA